MLLGELFDTLFERLDELITQARNAGIATTIQAGIQARLVLEAAKSAYLELLDKTIEELEDLVQDTMDELERLILKVENETFEDIQEVMDKAEDIALTLPFADTRPQVRNHTPRFIVSPDGEYSVGVEFEGRFIQQADQNNPPVLHLVGRGIEKSYPVKENHTKRLLFWVPITDLMIAQEPGGRGYSYASLKLEARWKEPKLIPGFGSVDTSIFNTLIGALPASPGTIVLSHPVDVPPNTVVKKFVSPTHGEYRQDSLHAGSDRDHMYTIVPEAGWTMIKGTWSFDLIDAVPKNTEGTWWWWNFVNDDVNQLSWTVTTLNKGVAGAIVVWRMSYDASKPDTPPDPEWVAETVELRWNQPLVYNYPKWKITFTPFTGSGEERYGNQNLLDHPFITIEDEIDAVRIHTPDPATLRLPPGT